MGVSVAGFTDTILEMSTPAETPIEGPVYCALANAIGIAVPKTLARANPFGPTIPKEVKTPITPATLGGTVKNPVEIPAPATPDVVPDTKILDGVIAQVYIAVDIAPES